jgi:hypothetical protein
MTERRFFRITTAGSAVLTLVLLAWDHLVPHAPPSVLPFGEPWLSIVGGLWCWVMLVLACHAARWIYLLAARRLPHLK